MVAGQRWLSAIELVDPEDGAPFRPEDENAVRYVAERYARFLGEHGVVVDVAIVARFALNR